uniref:Transposase-associated domain-containing protein n=1 Tax=Tanacetum cinerariifolium TaxID=118510 RepID=A0A6L2L4A6_TANCI|nr:hypothetical protein [Tanacetum cinerariifolium]
MVIDKSWTLLERHEKAFYTGLTKFVDDCKPLVNSDRNVKCPCKSCRTVLWVSSENLSKHITRYGWDPGYKTWVHHGEPDLLPPPPVIDNTRQPQISDMIALLNDLSYIPPNNEQNEPTQGDIGKTSNEPTQAKRNEFEELYASANEELYPDYDYVTRLDFMTKFTYFKVRGKLTDSIFNEMLEFFQHVFPTMKGYMLPPSYYAIKNTFKTIGLGYESIHACVNDGFLFRGDNNKDVHFYSKTPGKKVPKKVLRYFSIIPRLQCLYKSSHTAKEMTWHEEDPDVIHFDNSSNLPLSTSLNVLDNATLHIHGQSTEVDAPPDMTDLDEDDDIIDDEDALPHDLTDFDDEDLVNVDNDGVDMSADIAQGHDSDGGGDDRPTTHHIPTGCERKADRLHTCQETRNLRLKNLIEDKGPVPIRFEWDDKKTLMPLGEHASHWSNYLGELIREMPLYCPSWQKVPAERKATIITKIETQFDLKPHIQSQRWTDINAGIQQHLQKLYNTNKASLKAATSREYYPDCNAPLRKEDIGGDVEAVGSRLQHLVGPPPPQCSHNSADVEKLKKKNKHLTEHVNLMMKLFRSDDKFSQMLNQYESSPEFDNASGSGGCGDDEMVDDEDGDDDEED